jgi:hypothetical protein
MGKYRNITLIEPKLCINHWKVLENVLRSTLSYPNETSKECIQFLNTKEKHSVITSRENINTPEALKSLHRSPGYKKTNWSYVKTMSCSGSHLGISINIKNKKFVKDLPMIDAQFRFLGFLCRSEIQDGCLCRT